MAYEFNQAPKGLDEQRAAFKKAYPTLESLSNGRSYVMQPKYDGCLAIVVADPTNPRILTRTGETVLSMWHVLQQALDCFPGFVLFGEAYKWDTPFKTISGAFRRHSPQPDLLLALFDMVPVQAWEYGFDPEPFSERRTRFTFEDWRAHAPSIFVAPTLDFEAPQVFANSLVKSGGYDGAILRDVNAPWRNGACKDGEVIKVKPVQSLDLAAVGWFHGKGKHEGRAGGITVIYNGVTTDVGTGFTDLEREDIARDPEGFMLHRIAEVEFMEVTSDGKLREPRFKGWRYDKDKAD